jgi:hypothetical protein
VASAIEMQYVLLVYEHARVVETAALPDTTYLDDGAPRLLAEYRLHCNHAVTTVGSNGGAPVVTDGLYTDPSVPLGRICVIEAAHFDGALRFAKRVAASAAGVEIRPVRSS